MRNFIHITPFIHVPDIEAALRFLVDILGFACPFRMTDYAYVEREGCGVRLLQNRGDDGAPPGNRRFAYYIDVRDLDSLHAELKPRLEALPPRDVHGPVNQHYGQRELMIVAPDGNLIVFGQRAPA